MPVHFCVYVGGARVSICRRYYLHYCCCGATQTFQAAQTGEGQIGYFHRLHYLLCHS